jgi:hypothetical protein
MTRVRPLLVVSDAELSKGAILAARRMARRLLIARKIADHASAFFADTRVAVEEIGELMSIDIQTCAPMPSFVVHTYQKIVTT